MQTLNVGAGRTDDEYNEAQERHREELREDSQSDANYFFWAAGLAATSSGILPIQIHFLINIGLFDLLEIYGRPLGPNYPLVAQTTVVTWVMVLCALGFAARKGYRWAFWAGIFLYGADMLALMVTFSVWAFGVHAFFSSAGSRAKRRLRISGSEGNYASLLCARSSRISKRK